MRRPIGTAFVAMCLALGSASAVRETRLTGQGAAAFSPTPVLDWSNEARRAIVPAGPGGIFGPENYGNKFPGEAAVYMGIVHAAIYDAAAAIDGGYRPYAITLTAPAETSRAAAIATAAHHVLVGLQPALGLTSAQQALLDGRYAAYLSAIPDDAAKTNGIAIGQQVASAVLILRANDGRERNPELGDLGPPPPAPGIWNPGPDPALGLRLPAIRPLAMDSGAQFRPDGPNTLTSHQYAGDFQEVEALGHAGSMKRTEEQTTQALFWTDHDLRQWNDGMLNLAVERRLDLVQTARMLALAHVAGGDAMIACFDAKYTYWFWRPYQAIPMADVDGNAATAADPTWRPLRATPNFPEYPSAHACHSTAIAEALQAFFGTDNIPFSLDSRVTGTTRSYARLHDVIRDVDWARVLVGFHFRNSDQEGTNLGRKVARHVVRHRFSPPAR
ncbi:MAG TPA: vanadium-dependent haloperoxidase [Vicinamibacterales bacterium]|nr:vanadium-dependent haloperoxidase [Vicinamibacterales bacterium]